jgi:hypothetical protein
MGEHVYLGRLENPQGLPRGRTAKEPRKALRKAFGLPPYTGDYADDCRHVHGTKA